MQRESDDKPDVANHLTGMDGFMVILDQGVSQAKRLKIQTKNPCIFVISILS